MLHDFVRRLSAVIANGKQTEKTVQFIMFRREENLFRKVKRRIFPPAVVMIFIKAVDAALLEIAFQVEHLPDPALRNGNIRSAAEIPCRAGKIACRADAEPQLMRDFRLAGEVTTGSVAEIV